MIPGSNAFGAAEARSGTRFRRVLVCLDRSETAEVVLPLATYLAQMDGGRVTLLHVLEASPGAAEARATDALEWDIVRQEAHAYLKRLAKGVADLGVTADTQIVEGSPAHSVAALAAELEADLVVLSTYGEGGVDEWTLGSNAQKILALARGAVLVVPADAGEPATRVPPRCVLVPLDGSVRAESVLPTLLHLARTDDAEIVLAHAVPAPHRTELLSTSDDLALAQELADRLGDRADYYLGRIRSQLAASGVSARTVVRRATDHREGIVALATAERADLLLVSAHGSTCNPRRRFGSVTSYLIAHSTTPVLVLQDLPDDARRTASSTRLRRPSRSSDAPIGGA